MSGKSFDNVSAGLSSHGLYISTSMPVSVAFCGT